MTALEKLLHVQSSKYEELTLEHFSLKDSFASCKAELSLKEEEVISLRKTVRQQAKENEALLHSLQNSEANIAMSKKAYVEAERESQRLKAEIAQLTNVMAGMQAEHKAELKLLDFKLATLSDMSQMYSESSNSDHALFARVSELEEKLVDLESRREGKASRELMRTPSVKELDSLSEAERNPHSTRVYGTYLDAI